MNVLRTHLIFEYYFYSKEKGFAQGMVGNPRNSTAPARNNVRIEFSVVETTYDNCQQIFLRTLFQEMVLNGVF